MRNNTFEIITRSSDQHCIRIGTSKCLFLCHRITISADRHTNNICAVGGSVVNTFDDSSYIARSVALHDSHRHNECVRVGTRDTDTVIADRSCYTGTVGTMTVEIVGYTMIIDKIPTMNIILETIRVIVLSANAVSLGGVRPDIRCQIGVLNVHARIQNGNHRTLGAFLGFIPERRKVNRLQAPLLAIERLGGIGLLVSRRNIFLLVRQRHGINDIVRFSELHLVYCFEAVDGFVHRLGFLGFERQAVEFAQILYLHLTAIIGFYTATDILVSGHRHQLLYGVHA